MQTHLWLLHIKLEIGMEIHMRDMQLMQIWSEMRV